MSGQCRDSVEDDGPALNQHRVNNLSANTEHPPNAGPSTTTLAQHRSKHRADVPRPLNCVHSNQIQCCHSGLQEKNIKLVQKKYHFTQIKVLKKYKTDAKLCLH